MCAWQSGGGAALPTQLGYAEILLSFSLDDASGHTPIPGLSITATVPGSVLYCLEFFCEALDENSGSTAGERLILDLLRGADIVGQATNVNDVGGFGDATYCRTGTLTGDGLSHTYTATVGNVTTPLDGAIVQARPETPAYIRLLRLG